MADIVLRLKSPRPLLIFVPLCALACQGSRAKLEQLVPDGATAIISVDGKGFFASDFYKSVRGLNPEMEKKIDETLGEIRDKCDVDLEKLESAVMGIDALTQSGMGAVRIPNIGKADALSCLSDLAKEKNGKALWTVGETDGKPSLTIEDGEALGWAQDDDTLVISTKKWTSAVKARLKGESKSAIDNNLKEAVALADRSKHVWMAGQMPAIVRTMMEDNPAGKIEYGAASVNFAEVTEYALAVKFVDDAAAKDAEALVRPQIEVAKELAKAEGLPEGTLADVELEVDGDLIRGTWKVDTKPVLEGANAAFSKYINRSKTAEARVQLAKIFDSTAAYFNEEHIEPGEVTVIGGGTISDLAPHACPNNGKPKGESGITPPLSLKCSEGPGGRCVPAEGGSDREGYYDLKLWQDNPVWEALNFQMEQAHYFHYNFKWDNTTTGFGACQFTVQAFGDLDGDGIYSTYERAGAADQNGINAAAGLYIDQELE